jgi:hypothetical protein
MSPGITATVKGKSMYRFVQTALLTTLCAGTALAGTSNIDFADSAGTVNSFSSRGYDFNSGYVYILQNNPSYEFWALNGGDWEFTMTEASNQPFDLQEIWVQLRIGPGPSLANGTVFITGNLQAGGTVTTQVDLQSIIYSDNTTVLGEETVGFDSAWTNLASVDVTMSVTTNNLTSFLFDNFIARSGPVIQAEIDLDTSSPNRPVHPHHDGGPEAVAGLNDVIEVVVMGASTSVGDSADLNTDDIDPSTLRFGPASAAVDSGSTSSFNENYDSDGLNDARFHFLTGDTGVECSDTELTLTGELTDGTEFSGIDISFAKACNATCHN